MAAYQVIVLKGGNGAFEEGVTRVLKAQVHLKLKELGIPKNELTFLSEADIVSSPSAMNPKLPAVAVYISGTRNPPQSAAVNELQRRAILTLPFVRAITQFTHLVPEALRKINGMQPDAADPTHGKLVGRLLEELRLLRRRRSAFISYRRVESSGVAEQLREQLHARRYEVFLDSYSVEYGVDFQSALWEELGNTDVVVLLNTTTVFDSQWVEQEVTRTGKAGIAVLRLIWPNVRAQRGLEFAEPVYLTDKSFKGGAPASSPRAKLVPSTVARLAAQVEQLRARAQAARRCRVIEELKAATARANVQMSLEHDGVARLERKAGRGHAARVKRVIPVVGYPDAVSIEEYQGRVPLGSPAWGHLIYDSLGMMGSARAQHLAWLNKYLPAKSQAIQDIEQWLKSTLP
jgi:hypothetical protein